MSFVLAAPQMMAATATDLAGIGSAVTAAAHTASTSTTQLLSAASDEVSTQIAALFSPRPAIPGAQRTSGSVS